jgi:hypothetical protein
MVMMDEGDISPSDTMEGITMLTLGVLRVRIRFALISVPNWMHSSIIPSPRR